MKRFIWFGDSIKILKSLFPHLKFEAKKRSRVEVLGIICVHTRQHLISHIRNGMWENGKWRNSFFFSFLTRAIFALFSPHSSSTKSSADFFMNVIKFPLSSFRRHISVKFIKKMIFILCAFHESQMVFHYDDLLIFIVLLWKKKISHENSTAIFFKIFQLWIISFVEQAWNCGENSFQSHGN